MLGSAVGMLGVGAASALAGQASLYCRHELERRGSGGAAVRLSAPPLLRRKDLILDALLGVVLFKARAPCRARKYWCLVCCGQPCARC